MESVERCALETAATVDVDGSGYVNAGLESARVIATGDFNGDGISDLIVGSAVGTGDVNDFNPAQRQAGVSVTFALQNESGAALAQPTG